MYCSMLYKKQRRLAKIPMHAKSCAFERASLLIADFANMDSPPPIPSTSRLGPSGSASGSTAAGSAGGLPVSELDSLSATELSQVQTEIATELFGFSPSQFTSRIVDLANDVIYDVVDKVETEVLKRWAAEGSATTSGETLEERRQRVLKVVIHANTRR